MNRFRVIWNSESQEDEFYLQNFIDRYNILLQNDRMVQRQEFKVLTSAFKLSATWSEMDNSGYVPLQLHLKNSQLRS